jgi:N6-adenosine-specific RNA methylase IME4
LKYGTIVADPPWPLGKVNSGWNTTSVVRLPYTQMSLERIAALPVKQLAARDSHLYLWTVTSVLRHTFEIVEAWGFKPKKVLVWCKPGLGSGRRFRSNAEFIVFGARGSYPVQRHDVGTWHQWPRRRHSEKPDEFFTIPQTCSPGPRLELFARKPRPGWHVWGDQVESDIEIRDELGGDAE